MKSIRLILALFIFVAGTFSAFCQADDPILDIGFKPYGSFHGGDLDSVNLSNGILNLHIPVLTYPQRGEIGYSVQVMYNNLGWSVFPNCNSQTSVCAPIWQWKGKGVNLNTQSPDSFGASQGPLVKGSTTMVYRAGTYDGGKHLMATNLAGGVETLDGTAIWYDGTVFPNTGASRDHRGVLDNSGSLEDPNGNIFSFPTTSLNMTDTLGRNFPSTWSSNTTDFSGCTGPLAISDAAIISFPGYNGATRLLKLCNVTASLQSNFQESGYYIDTLYQIAEGHTSAARMLQSVVLYNGTDWTQSLAWTFEYNSRAPGDSLSVNYGDLTKITFPTGGSIAYTWANIPGCDPSGVTPCNRQVASRIVDANDGSGGQIWKYNGGIVTDPNLNDTVHTFTGLNGPVSLYETKTQYYEGSHSSGQLLKTVDTEYQWMPNPFDNLTNAPAATAINVFPKTITTTWPSGKVTKIEKDYDSKLVFSVPGVGRFTGSYGNVIETREFDYGNGLPGPLLRRTDYTYKAFDGSALSCSFLAFNMLDRISSVTTYDGSGTQVAQTRYGYDEFPLEPSGITTQHDSAPSNGGTRGNRTSQSQWLNTTGATLTLTTTYYDTGTPYQMTDPGGHTTTNFYGIGFQSQSGFAGAYVTQTQNALQQSVFSDYDFTTGLTTGTRDANGAVTSFDYDIYGRTRHRIAPDLGTTTWTYNDTQPPSFTAAAPVTSALTRTVEGDLDGLGRMSHSKLLSDPAGTDIVDTTYDGLGRVTTVTNPHRSGASTTDGITTTIYDALGRVKQVTYQDGSISTSDYSQFPIVTVTDPAGNQRQSRTDALGRLVEVDEPTPGITGVASQGSVSMTQLFRTPVTVGAQPASTASWSTTLSGAEKSTLVTTQPATSGSVNIQIAGSDNYTQSCTDPLPPKLPQCNNIYDTGTLIVTVNVNGTLISQQAGYGNSSPAALANSLQNSFATSNSALFTVQYVTGADNFTLIAKATGAATNYPISYSITSSQGGSGFSFSRAPAAFTGGADAVTATRFDAGSVGVTVNAHQDSTSFGQGDTAVTVANRLIAAINVDVAAYASAALSSNSADQTSATIKFTARTTGAGGNYPVSSSYSFDTADFSSSSFVPTAATVLTSGVNASSGTTYYDSGTVTMTVGSFTATAPYGPSTNNTATAVAAALAGSGSTGLNRPGSPVSATASGAGIILSYLTPGQAGNVTVNVSSVVDPGVSAYFSGSTYSGSSSLTGGVNPVPGDLTNPYVTLYFYDALDNLLCVEQHGNVSGTGCSAAPSSDATSPWRVRRFTYDSLSRLLIAHNPESGTISYSYDADGNLLQKTSPAPNAAVNSVATQTVSHCYDQLHRLTSKAYSAQSCPLASPVITYAYDVGTNAIGHLSSLNDQAGSASYTYDILGRIASETRIINGVSKSMSYDYNLNGSIKTIHYPSGAAVTYTPDSAGRVLSAIDAGNNINYVTSASYQADGQVLGFISGNATTFAGITNTFSYNKRLQPINMGASAPSQTVFSIGYDFHYGAGNNGNVWGITNYKDNSRNQSFTYDLLNRLTTAQNAGTNCAAKTVNGATEYWGNSYGYDAWGNLTNKTITKCSAENLSAPSLVNNQLSGYGYDAAGNMTTDPTDNVTLSYDQENRITGAAGYTYTYDADGNRVKKTNGTTGTLYWYMTPGIVAESDLSGTLKSEYIFFDGERVARRDLVAPGGVFYYFSDHLKTASVITDSLGNIKSESDYYPWGGELQFVNNDSNHYKFTGKERDETGLDYFGARYYSNGLARFITPDWAAKATAVPYAEFADPQSLNLYTYVRNVPTSKADADGHDAIGDIIYTGIAIAASKIGPYVGAVADALSSFPQSGSAPHIPGLPSPACTCAPQPSSGQSESKNNNNSQNSNTAEQGRDAQGKFTSKQPGQSAPGAAAEKQGLDSVGAVKNAEKLNGTVRDGTIPETGQHVEVKSGGSINNTEQLQKMGQAATDATGQPLKVITTNPNAKVSGPAKLNENLDIHPLKKK